MARGQIQIPILFFKTREQNRSYLANMRETGILKEYLPIQTNGSSMMPVIVTLFMLDSINTLLGLLPGSLSVLKGSAMYSVLLFLGCVAVNMISLEDSVSKMGEYTSKVRVGLKPIRQPSRRSWVRQLISNHPVTWDADTCVFVGYRSGGGPHTRRAARGGNHSFPRHGAQESNVRPV
jgi:hypothetical protein